MAHLPNDEQLEEIWRGRLGGGQDSTQRLRHRTYQSPSRAKKKSPRGAFCQRRHKHFSW